MDTDKKPLRARFLCTRIGFAVNLPDYIVFKGLLVWFEDEVIDFSSQFTTEEVQAMRKQYGREEL